MQLQLRGLTHPKDGYKINFDKLIDIDPLFKHRDDNKNRDFCVYFIYDGAGRLVYIGEGIYYSILKYTIKKFLKSRAFNHKQNSKGTELVAANFDINWSIQIAVSGLTKIEGVVLESYFIRKELKNGRKLSAKGAKEWDGDSLMNKTKGRSDKVYSDLRREYLNA